MFDIFLSHAHQDEARARSLCKRLESWGFSVYVDYGDAALSQLPDRALADRLVGRLRQCRLLVFAFSEASANSRWMPWELGLAHGVIGRAVLWPFTQRALRAKAVQEYLHLYEALQPRTAQHRLDALLGEARAAAVRPADLRAMQDLAQITEAKRPEFGNPEVATEFMAAGPMKLYLAWLESLSRAWRPK
ncbi:MAG: toll/interleukin-1 receptor domain-containing protein [Denitromonas halophila]|nr:MAG: toll/interleukin-1 receptor domain-containing protein [Denitromonas halophila]TVT69275.1 MAG: toll/interleukin-1 receptor domain-containing protein [Denitromonas halophila]